MIGMRETEIRNAVFFLVVSLTGCSGALDREDYVRWVHDYAHELHVEKDWNDFVFDLQFTPAEYVWLQRHRENNEKNRENYEREIQKIEQSQYYKMTIRVKDSNMDFINHDISTMEEKQRKLYYFSYTFQDDIRLEENGESLPCILYHFERSVDVKNSRTFLLGFQNPDTDSKEATLVINSEQFGSLPVKIKVSKNNTPLLAI